MTAIIRCKICSPRFLGDGAILLLALLWCALSCGCGSDNPTSELPRPTATVVESAEATSAKRPLNKERQAAERGAKPNPVRLRDPIIPNPKFDFKNQIGMKFIRIPAGEFLMGSTPEDRTRFRKYLERAERDIQARFSGGEQPAHKVIISQPFLMSIYEVTVGNFRTFVEETGYKTRAESQTGSAAGAHGWSEEKQDYTNRGQDFSWRNTGFRQTDLNPVGNLAWSDAVAFCDWLSKRESRTYRLPTEAEWEYACRAGSSSLYHHGDDPEELIDVANVADASYKTKLSHLSREFSSIRADDGFVFSAPVGMFHPNSWGLFDMHGNVSEMCSDFYNEKYYGTSPETDPQGPEGDKHERHVCRGGSWRDAAGEVRSANRIYLFRDYRYSYYGLRVVLEQPVDADSE